LTLGVVVALTSMIVYAGEIADWFVTNLEDWRDIPQLHGG
jgi:hypothetical protein